MTLDVFGQQSSARHSSASARSRPSSCLPACVPDGRSSPARCSILSLPATDLPYITDVTVIPGQKFAIAASISDCQPEGWEYQYATGSSNQVDLGNDDTSSPASESQSSPPDNSSMQQSRITQSEGAAADTSFVANSCQQLNPRRSACVPSSDVTATNYSSARCSSTSAAPVTSDKLPSVPSSSVTPIFNCANNCSNSSSTSNSRDHEDNTSATISKPPSTSENVQVRTSPQLQSLVTTSDVLSTALSSPSSSTPSPSSSTSSLAHQIINSIHTPASESAALLPNHSSSADKGHLHCQSEKNSQVIKPVAFVPHTSEANSTETTSESEFAPVISKPVRTEDLRVYVMRAQLEESSSSSRGSSPDMLGESLLDPPHSSRIPRCYQSPSRSGSPSRETPEHIICRPRHYSVSEIRMSQNTLSNGSSVPASSSTGDAGSGCRPIQPHVVIGRPTAGAALAWTQTKYPSAAALQHAVHQHQQHAVHQHQQHPVHQHQQVCNSQSCVGHKQQRHSDDGFQPLQSTSGNGHQPLQSTSGNGYQSLQFTSGNGHQLHQQTSGNGYRPHQPNSANSYQLHHSGNGYQPHQPNSGNGYQPHQPSSGNSNQPHQPTSGNGCQPVAQQKHLDNIENSHFPDQSNGKESPRKCADDYSGPIRKYYIDGPSHISHLIQRKHLISPNSHNYLDDKESSMDISISQIQAIQPGKNHNDISDNSLKPNINENFQNLRNVQLNKCKALKRFTFHHNRQHRSEPKSIAGMKPSNYPDGETNDVKSERSNLKLDLSHVSHKEFRPVAVNDCLVPPDEWSPRSRDLLLQHIGGGGTKRKVDTWEESASKGRRKDYQNQLVMNSAKREAVSSDC